MFGCLTTHKALKDCSWDYDSYECVMCTVDFSDEDLGYHIIRHGDDDEVKFQDECAANDYFWGFLQVTNATHSLLQTLSCRHDLTGFVVNHKQSVSTLKM